ncbi:Pentatricopeptide repeat-containing protein [Apostasia shenzhenica]|uniref:Pentatricopeptide repeat-containing protein n=1 Tax=Apostasia shenzhenica TaxID=1088818 RepID=A0A2I0AQN3_9ASPA|nr:Pentatricopeptide repeat-containing protein [Apostasia shenzhenica]
MVFPFPKIFSRFTPWPTPSSLKQSTQLHAQLVVSGAVLHPPSAALLFQSVTDTGTGDLSYALRLFPILPSPSTFQWNSIIRACYLHHSADLSIHFFHRMRRDGLEPDYYTFQFLFKSLALSSTARQGHAAHGLFIRLFPVSDRGATTSLILLYVEFQQEDEARKVFEEIPVKNVVSWTTIVTGFAKAGFLDDARRLFDEMPERNLVSWTGMITGYSKSGRPTEAIELFRTMLAEGVMPDAVAFVPVLAACAQMKNHRTGRWIHQLVEKLNVGFNENLIVTIVDMYAKCGDILSARQVFDEMARSVRPAWNALIDGYCKLGLVDTARSLFDQMQSHDLITFNSMITGYIHSSKLKEAFSLFSDLRSSGFQPDKFTVVSLLSACASLGAFDQGKSLHAFIETSFIKSDIFMNTALLDMYAKCGKMELAKQVFDRMPERDLMSWTAVISGFAMNGLGRPALEHFCSMKEEGIQPNPVAYIAVLNACSHSGLIDEGRKHLQEMQTLYDIEPEIEHYGCMVDLYGRVGRLEEAEKLIKSMRIQPSDVIWGSFLRSCRLQKKLDLAEWAARELLAMEPERDVGYVELFNAYMNAGRWEEACRIRGLMEERGVKKIAAFSSIAIGGEVHKFVAGDQSHPDITEIRETVAEMKRRMREAGYLPAMLPVMVEMDEEEREEALFGHSERLAVAFGIMRLGPGLAIRVVKNLRICEDCHSAMKMIAVLWRREITVRDRSRFHHFRDGRCSCNDFW